MKRFILSLLFTTAWFLVDASSSNEASSSRAFFRPHDYDIVREEVLFEGWRKVTRRTVQSPKMTKHIEFEVIDQTHSTGGAVIIFAWNSTSKSATIIREYMPGCHRVLGGLAAGLVEQKHGGSEEAAARHELEEECHLAGGTWYRLIDEGVSVPMDKYVQTEIVPYLVVDPHHVPNPKPIDDEEDIEIVSDVSADEIMQMVKKGDMNLVGGWGALLALVKLRELGEIE